MAAFRFRRSVNGQQETAFEVAIIDHVLLRNPSTDTESTETSVVVAPGTEFCILPASLVRDLRLTPTIAPFPSGEKGYILIVEVPGLLEQRTIAIEGDVKLPVLGMSYLYRYECTFVDEDMFEIVEL